MSNITFDNDTVRICGRSSLSGKVCCPSSKSVTHRELIAAALADGDSYILCRGLSKDIIATAECLSALGANIVFDGDRIKISPIKTPNKKAVLFCNESGTTLRFMIPLAAFLGVDATFVCAPGLERRPVSVLCDELARHGIDFPDGYTFPLRMRGRAAGGEWSIRGDISSQFISGILLALPLANEPSTLKIIGKCESLPYIDVTRESMKKHGVCISFENDTYSYSGGSYTSSGTEDSPSLAEADWSGAAFWLAAGLTSEGGITVEGLSENSAQGDKAILPLLRSVGANIFSDGHSVTAKKSTLSAFDCDCSQTPDMVPILSVCAAVASGESKIRGIERLRLKESDRIESSIAMLASLGIKAVYENGTMTVYGGKIKGGRVNGYNDHRIVMSAAVATCFTEGGALTEITDAHAVEKSYPDFWEHFSALCEKE